MAFVPLVPVSQSLSINQGLSDKFSFPLIKNSGGTNIDLSAWDSLTAVAIPPTPGPTAQDVEFGAVTGAAAGVLSMISDPTDFDGYGAGNCKYIVKGKPTSGDEFQTLVTGTLTLNAA